MTYTVTELISSSLVLSGISSREFEQPTDTELADGLDELNFILADKTVNDSMLAYKTRYPLTAIAGQEEYYIPNLISADTLTFNIDTVRYPMVQLQRDEYYGRARANNITSLPFSFHVEREFGGARLSMYYLPDQAYVMNLWGFFRLSSVIATQDLQSGVATANLGATTVVGSGTLATGNLVINGIDLAGAYSSAITLRDYINTGVVANVTASYDANGFTLTSSSNTSLVISTNGTADTLDSVTFFNFSTVGGELEQTYFAMALDLFYIGYIRYELASRLCGVYNIPVPGQVGSQLQKYNNWIDNKSAPMDLRTRKTSTLSNSGNFNYGQANLGRGYEPT